MKFNVLNRQVHYWITPFLAIPILVIIGSGILLQVKKQWSWVQPEERRGSVKSPSITFDQLLTAVRSVPEFNATEWKDINRMDVRPSKGVAKVLLKNGWEVQVDIGSAKVIQKAYRRSDIIEAIHDGSFFAGDLTKLGIFLPAAIALFLLWLTGLWMFWLPFSVKLKRRKARLAKEAQKNEPG